MAIFPPISWGRPADGGDYLLASSARRKAKGRETQSRALYRLSTGNAKRGSTDLCDFLLSD
jgi:hypothetical protein